MTSTALAGPGAVASPRLPPVPAAPGPAALMSRARSRMHARPMRAYPACTVMPVRAVVLERTVVRQVRKRSWRIWASRLIWCTIVPQIHHRARINHVKSPYHRTYERIVDDDVRETREASCAGRKTSAGTGQ